VAFLGSREILKFLVRIYNVRNKFFLQFMQSYKKKKVKMKSIFRSDTILYIFLVRIYKREEIIKPGFDRCFPGPDPAPRFLICLSGSRGIYPVSWF